MFRAKQFRLTSSEQKEETIDLGLYEWNVDKGFTDAFFMDMLGVRMNETFNDGDNEGSSAYYNYFIFITASGDLIKIHDTDEGYWLLDSLLYYESGRLRRRHIKVRLRNV